MNIPSPAAVKKLTDERKAREAELASSLANAKDKMPPTKPESSRKRDSTPSHSSGKGKISRSGSSNSKRKTSTGASTTPSTKSTRTNTTSPADGRKDRASTSTTRRKSSSTESTHSAQPKSKKEFVRPEHLTQRPLRDNEALLGLKKSLEKPARGQFKREYRISGRQAGKSAQGRTAKKEN